VATGHWPLPTATGPTHSELQKQNPTHAAATTSERRCFGWLQPDLDVRSRRRLSSSKKIERWYCVSTSVSGALERLMELWSDDVLSFLCGRGCVGVVGSSPTRRHCDKLDRHDVLSFL
jgi:hypothetical protein